MSAVQSSVSHGQHVLNSRVQRSMEGWSIIEKITDFTHAVCRVKDGRGSAILIALPNQQHGGQCSAMDTGRAGQAHHHHHHQQQQQTRGDENIGVLLTTSFVFQNREEARGATVMFLEQPVAGTNARQGRRVEPLEVAVQVDKVFVCSTSCPPSRRPTHAGLSSASSRASQWAVADDDDDDDTNGASEDELGYTMTMCDMTPLVDGASPWSPATARGQDLSAPGDAGGFSFLPPLRHNSTSPLSVERIDSPSSTFESGLCGSSVGCTGMRTSTTQQRGLPIRPLPLPLLLSRIPPVCVGDRHLMITHTNGMERHYVVQAVKYVGKDSCEYDFFDPACEFSSGGPIFNMHGDFVGLQHQSGDHSYGIFISSIVRHLFQSTFLGLCRLPIVDVSSQTEEMFDMRAVVPDEVFNQPFHINQRYCVLNVGAGDQLIEYEDFKRLRLRNDIQGSTQPPSLVAPDGASVWQEFYADFGSLVHILHAFSHAPKLAKLALVEMTSHEHRHHLPNVASLGGIGAVLEIIDGYPQYEELVLAALTVLARTSLYKPNREAMWRCDGVLTVLEIMNEYSHHPSIQQWGFCCLYNVMAADSPVRTEAVALFARSQGIALAIEALRVHQGERHVLRHTGFALSCVADEDIRYAHTMVNGGIAKIIIDCMKGSSDDPFVFLGLATLLHKLLRHSLNDRELLTLDSTVSSLPWQCGEAVERTKTYSKRDAEHASACKDPVGCALLDTLVEGKVLTILGTVMACESQDTYSSAAVALLYECIGSVVVMLMFRLLELEEELAGSSLTETCRRIIQNFPTEKVLLQQAKRIVCLLPSST
ncbi:hypothetical protein DQ04_09921020 [Trypanosoma grayi]|uniref:hypothetical protein n=1 Tax=Trypanosoma grayi TaxID=71804 RepID=UPI0004F48A64|nr:hypothetical protein DQ04_09921020 [Trypanosoma grayi]KEG07398.1 hypothetical protein DQ04_09921020 [Trypanosoma grayi]